MQAEGKAMAEQQGIQIRPWTLTIIAKDATTSIPAIIPVAVIVSAATVLVTLIYTRYRVRMEKLKHSAE